MEPSSYIPRYLEREYMRTHPDLTDDARELLRAEIWTQPARYATHEHARALLAYAHVRHELIEELKRIEELPDEEYEQAQARLYDSARISLARIAQEDKLAVDARCICIMLAEVPLDACLNDLLVLEHEVASHLSDSVEGFDQNAPHFWDEGTLGRAGDSAQERTGSQPELVGWLHLNEVLALLCMASARYNAAAQYARTVMRAKGYPNMALGTLLFALARLEDEDGFFRAADELAQRLGDAEAERSPWYLLGRCLLLYKLGRRKSATRALRDFAIRCDGGAFFLLNPSYMLPYLPVRPPVHHVWEASHQALWEADGIISDTPDFAFWASTVEGIEALSENFADRHGF